MVSYNWFQGCLYQFLILYTDIIKKKLKIPLKVAMVILEGIFNFS